MKPIISIIIPVFNIKEDYLSACIRSVSSQTMEKIEIICVDDCSTNGSAALLQKAAAHDGRIRVITLDRNHGTCYARKIGVESAEGMYVLFLDGDDTLEPNACSVLYKEMCIHNVDILHFGTCVIPESYLDQDRVTRCKKNVLPYYGYLFDSNILDGCFKNSLFRHTLWNKLYRRSVLEEAFCCISDEYLVKAEDLYSFFLIAYYSKSYYGIRNNAFYNYRLGVGITGHSELSLNHLDLYCQNMCSWLSLKRFIESCNDLPPYYRKEFILQLRTDLIHDCISKYFVYLPKQLQNEGLPILRKYWTQKEIDDEFARLSLPLAG